MAADSFVLVGDHMQLPPLVISDVAEQAGKFCKIEQKISRMPFFCLNSHKYFPSLGYGVSMLKRLAEHFPDAVAQLKLQV